MKSQLAMFTAALMVCLTSSAWAQPTAFEDLHPSDAATAITADTFGAQGPQDVRRSPDTVVPVMAVAARVASSQDLRSPDTVVPVVPAALVEPEPAPAATAPEVVLVPDDGGLSVLMIVLISIGGAAALAGAAFFAGSRSAVHHRPPVA